MPENGAKIKRTPFEHQKQAKNGPKRLMFCGDRILVHMGSLAILQKAPICSSLRALYKCS
jgi:hypothetical protein